MEFLLGIAALVVLAWWLVVTGRGGLLAGCLAVLVAGIFFGASFYRIETEPIPVTADRLLFVALLAQYAICLKLGWAEWKPLGKADVVLAALLVVLTASTLTHPWQVRGAEPLARLLFYFFMPAALYGVARQTEITPRLVRGVTLALALVGVYVGSIAILEWRQLDALVFPRYIASPEHIEFLGRARGPLLNPAANGILLAVCLTAGLLWWPAVGRWGKLGLVLFAAVLLLAVYGTLTRTAWMGAAAALGTLSAVTLPRQWRGLVLIGLLVLGAMVVVTQGERLMAFRRDRHLSAQETAESVRLRPVLAMVAWKMFLDKPLLGHGFGQYMTESRTYLSDRDTQLVLESARPFTQHNVWLALLAETGLTGAGLFTLLFVFWTRDAWRLWRSRELDPWLRRLGLLWLGSLAGYLPNAMMHDASIMPMVNMLIFFVAGTTAAARVGGSRGSLVDAREE